MAILQAIGTWLLKIFLGGLFNKVMTQIEDEAKQKEAAAKLHAESTETAAQAEIDIIKAQSAVKDQYRDNKDAPKDAADPFGNEQWNQGV
jgi:cell division protein FtsB